MLGFIKKCLFTGLAFLSTLTSVNLLSCISVNNQECKDFTKIKFDTDDNLLLNKSSKLRMLTIIVRSVFEEDGKFYRHIYLHECLHEL